jgi:hypothetical protein
MDSTWFPTQNELPKYINNAGQKQLQFKRSIITGGLPCRFQERRARQLICSNLQYCMSAGSQKRTKYSPFLPPLENLIGRRDKLVALSRQQFATRRAVIEDKLNRWMA